MTFQLELTEKDINEVYMDMHNHKICRHGTNLLVACEKCMMEAPCCMHGRPRYHLFVCDECVPEPETRVLDY